ncbi:MAG TPA: universal stress protein [Thermoanaerobaculia bacterium]|nr:universal stress protein [Thermoanaerobaculia bacterium]
MPKRLRVLVAVDFSAASRRALRSAARLAARTGAKVTVAHVRPAGDLFAAVAEDRTALVRLEPKLLRRRLDAHYRQRLAAAAGRIPGAGMLLLRGWPAIELARVAARGFDMIVVGSRGRSEMRMAFLGSTTREILRRSRVPVLVVESPSRPAR